MRRHLPSSPSPSSPNYHYSQPMDLLAASVMPELRQRMNVDDSAEGTNADNRKQETEHQPRGWCLRHWQSIVWVVCVVSLLFTATLVGVVWWHWKLACPVPPSQCSANHDAQTGVASQVGVQKRNFIQPSTSRIVPAMLLNAHGERLNKKVRNWLPEQLVDFTQFTYNESDGSLTVPQNGIYFVYSKVSFVGSPGAEKTVFKHEIREVKDHRDRLLLHNVVQSQCRSSVDGVCHSSVLVSTLWLRTGFKVYVVAHPTASLSTASRDQFGIALISQ